MAVSIQDLIKQKEKIKARKKEMIDIETSVGVITIKKPSRSIVMEANDMDNENGEADKYLIINSVVEPNIKDSGLQKAYGCVEPTDIVDRLFDYGEITSISKAIIDAAGYGKGLKTQIHKELKN
jgi:hypothetical protein